MYIQTKKELLQSRESSIKKSNEISMAELNYGLCLNQMQLLAYAIYSTQQDGKTEFQKHEFQKKFGIEQYRTEDAYKDGKAVKRLEVSVKDLENDYFRFTSVFIDMEYNKGKFMFEWNPKITPHILELKERYIVMDLEVASHFKSGFSWRLYEYLKAHYGYFRKILTKQETLQLFNVEDKKTYQRRTNDFKNRVLNVAIKEINQYTELQVWYKEQKKGRSIVGFEIHWTRGKANQRATKKQIGSIQSVMDRLQKNHMTYVRLRDTKKRIRAFEIIDVIENYRSVLTEPINITVEHAHEIMQDIDEQLKELNALVNTDKPIRDTSFYYNWLEDEE